ncbi:MAG: hypothetical protein JWM74_5389, partial [Myxococcaceae bacterium]|nr:hypothetical protein [Myxococcaceae bacterium]
MQSDCERVWAWEEFGQLEVA